ncbi:hypothetical protein MesoLj131a_29800 [Mesorhizobium sp. 131-2-1]|nr:hypothetical protein MesoLj131a_29800 [Mesorhizobium sp. 131-2-1]
MPLADRAKLQTPRPSAAHLVENAQIQGLGLKQRTPQVWRIKRERWGNVSETRNLAAILADVVGYSRLAGSNEDSIG